MPLSPGSPWPCVSWQHERFEITALLCGIGLIRAAAATEFAIATYKPRAIFNFGCAGSHRRDINLGDVVIGTRTVAYSIVIAPDGSPRYDLLDGADEPIPGKTGFAADLELLTVASRVAKNWSPDPSIDSDGESTPTQVHRGVVASADIWTQSADHIDLLAKRHLSMCEDMEAAAIAQICAMHDVPFLTIKDISNNELRRATLFDRIQLELPDAEVGRWAATLVGRVIDALAGS